MNQRFERSGGQRQWAVVVAMVTVREVQMPIDQIIHVVIVRDHFMPAAGAVDVIDVVTGATVSRSARGRIGRAHHNDVLIDVVAMRDMQMAIMQIINMVIMVNGGMAAVGTMLVGVIGVLGAGGHGILLWEWMEGHQALNQLGRMPQDIADQIADVRIGQRIEHMFGLAPPLDQPRAMEGLQPRGYAAGFGLFQFHQFAHAALALCQPDEQAQPRRIAQRLAHPGGQFQLPGAVGGQRSGDDGVVMAVEEGSIQFDLSIYDFIE